MALAIFWLKLFEIKCYVLAGCCTSCAVRVKSGQLRQPEALGISVELKSKVCALYFGSFYCSNKKILNMTFNLDLWTLCSRELVEGQIFGCALYTNVAQFCRGNNLKFCLVDERVQGGKKNEKDNEILNCIYQASQ
jgi:hypothetical protein